MLVKKRTVSSEVVSSDVTLHEGFFSNSHERNLVPSRKTQSPSDPN